MTDDNSSGELAILKAVQDLDRRMTQALTQQTRQLQEAIKQLSDRQADALLEQEKRNATFADRERVEAVAEHQHAANNHVQTLILRVSVIEKRIVEIAVDIEKLRQTISSTTQGFLTGANGYLLTFLMLIIVGVTVALVTKQLK